jgi:hypothetical protein
MQTMEAKLEANVEKVVLELMGKILRLDRKFTLILVNQNALEFLLKVLRVIK